MKNFEQDGVNVDLQLGKEGLRLDGSSKTELVMRDKDGNLANIRAKAPVNGNDLVTLDYLNKKADIRVIDSISDLTAIPSAGQVTKVYYDQAGDQLVYGGVTDGGSTTVWDVLDTSVNFTVLATQEISDGGVVFEADHLYQWDASGSVWIDLGPAPEADFSDVVKNKTYAFTFTSATSGDVFTFATASKRVLSVVIDITTTFDNGITINDGTSNISTDLYDDSIVDKYKITTINNGSTLTFGVVSSNPTVGAGNLIVTYVE